MCQMIVGIVIHILDDIWAMIPKHIFFSLYKYFESIKNLIQNGQILLFFIFLPLKTTAQEASSQYIKYTYSCVVIEALFEWTFQSQYWQLSVVSEEGISIGEQIQDAVVLTYDNCTLITFALFGKVIYVAWRN